MTSHRFRRLPSQTAETAAAAAEQVLRREASPHRLASYGELRERETRERWWFRRGMLALLLFVAAGPIHHGMYVALVTQRVVQPAPVVERVAAGAVLPLRILYGAVYALDCPPLIGALRFVDSILHGVDLACGRTVQYGLGKQSLPRLSRVWLFCGIPLLLLGGYSLSPGPVWWGFRLCAVELLSAVYASMELLYAPLAWLVDRSRTLREFYEAYYDGMEWID